jgi:isopentenyldiphosphate isomerase
MPPKIYNKVVVADEDDNVIGAEFMMDAIKKGMIRRAARIYVFNESGQLLVQQRSKNVLKPLLLDQSAAGHVDEGETYLEAANRELFEELGLSGYSLTEVAISFRTTDFYNAIYKLVIPDNTVINFDPEELEQIMWLDISDLDSKMKNEPEKFTPAFLEAWSLLRDKLTSN